MNFLDLWKLVVAINPLLAVVRVPLVPGKEKTFQIVNESAGTVREVRLVHGQETSGTITFRSTHTPLDPAVIAADIAAALTMGLAASGYPADEETYVGVDAAFEPELAAATEGLFKWCIGRLGPPRQVDGSEVEP